METYNVIWLASSTVVGQLEKMLKNRFDEVIKVKKPTVKVLAVFLADRCEEASVQCDDPRGTLTRLAELSQQIPGLALRAIRSADRRRNKLLTLKMVEDHFFAVEEADEPTA